MNDYTHEWEVLTTRQTRFSDEQMLKMYISGLKDYIHNELKLWRPQTINVSRHTAKLIEQKNKVNKPSFSRSDRTNSYFNENSNKYNTKKTNKYVPPPQRKGEKQHQNLDKI